MTGTVSGVPRRAAWQIEIHDHVKMAITNIPERKGKPVVTREHRTKLAGANRFATKYLYEMKTRIRR